MMYTAQTPAVILPTGGSFTASPANAYYHPGAVSTMTSPLYSQPYMQPYAPVPAPILPQPTGYMYSYDLTPQAGAMSYVPSGLPSATSSFSTGTHGVSQPVRASSFHTYPASVGPVAATTSLNGSFVAPPGPAATGSYVPPVVDAGTGSFVPPVATSSSFTYPTYPGTYPGLPTVGSFVVNTPGPGPVGLAKLSAPRPFKFYVEPPEKRAQPAEGSHPATGAHKASEDLRPPVLASSSAHHAHHKATKKGKKSSSLLSCC
ncbi:Slc22a1 [Symbiodinium natans]|uniref:Slc22a1 protein n=1 Tax=Symbiodinium natans TaxID=878477 RepID=A0A812QNB5_9DINO|nr:Slc22a1 [Symbiodinium natans]